MFRNTNNTSKSIQRTAVVESLESRELMSASATWDGTNITVKGSSANDNIVVAVVDTYLPKVGLNREFDVTLNGKLFAFKGNPNVPKISVDGLGGNDSIQIVGPPTLTAIAVKTGDGNDLLDISQQFGGSIDWQAGGGTNTLNWRAPNASNGSGPTHYLIMPDAMQVEGTVLTTFSGVQNINFSGSDRDDSIVVDSVDYGQYVSVNGGKGNDTITVGNHNIANTIWGHLWVDGGSAYGSAKGVDTLIFDDFNSGGGLDTLNNNSFSKLGMQNAIVWNGIDNVTLNASNGIDYIYVDSATVKQLTINANAGNDVIRVGGTGASSSLGYVQTTTMNINGGIGNDGLSLNDQFTSGPNGYIINANKFKRGGTQTSTYAQLERIDLWASSGNNMVNAYNATVPMNVHLQNGNDTVWGGHANDSIYGGGGNDQLFGNDGDDFFDAGLGADYVSGGGGQDIVSYSTRSKNVKVNLNVQAGNGETGENDSIFSDVEVVYGGGGNDTITLRSGAAGKAYGYGGNDTLIGGNQNDYLDGGIGDDLLKGANGNDTLVGGKGYDRLSGGNNIDTIFANDGEKDLIDGGAGSNIINKDGIDVLGTIP